MLGFPRFAGNHGGGGNRTRVGSTPETLPLQELRWICEDAWRQERAFLDDFADRIHVATDELKEGSHTNLYVVFDGLAAKIGIADDPIKRARSIQISNPRPLILYAFAPATRNLESFVHRHFRDLRITGEWFRAEPPLLAFSDVVLSAQEQCQMMDDVGDGPCDVEDTLSILGLDLFREDGWRAAA